MTIFAHLTAAVLVASAITPAMATTYDCKLTGARSNSGIPERVIVMHDTASGQVAVLDTIIKYYFDGPLAGTLKSLNGTRALFAWTLRGITADSGQYAAGITYSLNVIRSSGEAQITGKPDGNYEAWRGSGTCTIE